LDTVGKRVWLTNNLLDSSLAPPLLSISFGVASIQPVKDKHKRNDLIDFADKALYASKCKGRNRVTVYTSRKQWFGKG
jgi:PleD family two-component response regulator